MLTSFDDLLSMSTLPELGPGPRQGVRSIDELNAAFRKLREASNDANADLAIAVVLLWHDHLDAAHSIAQAKENSDGSYAHAIMHRREPDYGNAKYWFKRVGRHECFVALAAGARELLDRWQAPHVAKRLMPAGHGTRLLSWMFAKRLRANQPMNHCCANCRHSR